MMASPLCDIATYTVQFERLLEQMWMKRADTTGDRLIRAKR
jgi:hypothetical protein